MPIPNLSTLCINVQTANKLCITFPGGAEICAHVGLETGDPSTILRGLLAQVNAALIPLQPIFNIIDVVKAVGDCIGAIKDAFGPPPDPSGIAKCIPELLKRLAKLLKLLPQYSVPLMVKQLLTALVIFLQAVKLELQSIILQQARILKAATAANKPGNASLLSVVDCATVITLGTWALPGLRGRSVINASADLTTDLVAAGVPLALGPGVGAGERAALFGL
jgi:hypothetical protein